VTSFKLQWSNFFEMNNVDLLWPVAQPRCIQELVQSFSLGTIEQIVEIL